MAQHRLERLAGTKEAEQSKGGQAMGIDLGVLQREGESGLSFMRRMSQDAKPKTFRTAIQEITESPSKLIPFVGGALEAKDLYSLYESVQAVDSGNASRDQQRRVAEYLMDQSREGGMGYNIGSILGEMPAFVGEFATTGGIASAGKKTVLRGLSSTVKRAIKDQAKRKVAVKVLNTLAVRVPVQVAAGEGISALASQFVEGEGVGGRIAASTWRRALPSMGIVPTPKDAEEMVVFLDSDSQTFLEALPEGIMDTYIEYVSENSGSVLTKLTGLDKVRALQLKILSDVGGAEAKGIREAMQRAAGKAGWHGVIGEWLEERAGAAMRAATPGMEEGWADVIPSVEQGVAEILAFSVVPAGSAAIAGTVGAAKRGQGDAQPAGQSSSLEAPAEGVAPQEGPVEGAQQPVAPEEVKARSLESLAKLNEQEVSEVEAPDSDEARTVAAVASRHGVDVVWAQGSQGALERGNGVSLGEGVVALDAALLERPGAAQVVLRHELLHDYGRKNPEGYARVVRLLRSVDAPGFDAAVESYAARFLNTTGRELEGFARLDEGTATRYEEVAPLVEFLATPEGAKALETLASKPGRVQAVLDFLRDLISKVPGISLPTSLDRRIAAFEQEFGGEVGEGDIESAKVLHDAFAYIAQQGFLPPSQRVGQQTAARNLVSQTSQALSADDRGPLTSRQAKRARQKANRQAKKDEARPVVAEMPRTDPDMFGETQEREYQRPEVAEEAASTGQMFQEDTGVRGQTSILDVEQPEEGRFREGMKVSTGETYVLGSGAQSTQVPKFGKSDAHNLRKLYGWLIDNAKLESERRGDNFNATWINRANPKNLSRSDVEALNLYLEEATPQPASITRPLVRPEPVTPEAPPKPVTTKKPTARETHRQRKERLAQGGPDVPFRVFIRANGGIRNHAGDFDAWTNKELGKEALKGGVGLPALIQSEASGRGMTFDHALNVAHHAGYIVKDYQQTDINDLLRLLESNPMAGTAAAQPNQQTESQYEQAIRKVMEDGYERWQAEELLHRAAHDPSSSYDIDGNARFSAPEPTSPTAMRRAIQGALRRHGFTRERSSGGSTYYRNQAGTRVRISDHEVPMTPEREYNRDRGGFSWASDGWNFIVNEESDWSEIEADLQRLVAEVPAPEPPREALAENGIRMESEAVNLPDGRTVTRWTAYDAATGQMREWGWERDDVLRRAMGSAELAPRFSLAPPIDSEAFRRWFGDSKVVDENGDPLVVYHGSAVERLTQFDPTKAGEVRTSDWTREGIYFTPSAWLADSYRETAVKQTDAEAQRLWDAWEAEAKRLGTDIMSAGIDLGWDSRGYARLRDEYEVPWRARLKAIEDGESGEVYGVYVSLQNPYVYTAQSITDPYLGDMARGRGHDGLLIVGEEGEIQEVVAFRPEQIKSATGNRGTFSAEDPDMRFALAPLEGTEGYRKMVARMSPSVKDAEGNPVRVLHATTHRFDDFSDERANPENVLGVGIYATSDHDDAATNYLAGGADLDNRISRRSEQLEQDEGFEEQYDELIESGDLDPATSLEDYARSQARRELQGPEQLVLELYPVFENPLVIGGRDETQFWMEYDEATGQKSGPLVQFIEALEVAASRYDDADVGQAVSDLLDHGSEFGAEGLIGILKASSGLMYATDYDAGGALVQGEVIRAAFEGMGFDGIVDRTVWAKFGSPNRVGQPMEGMSPSTVHYIGFRNESMLRVPDSEARFSIPGSSKGAKRVDRIGHVRRRGWKEFKVPRDLFSGSYHVKERDFLDAAYDYAFDRLAPVKRLADAAGARFNENDPALAEEMRKGRTKETLRHLETRYYRPIERVLSKYDLTMKDAGEHLYARHAGERNEAMKAIDPKERDGLSGMSDRDAAAILKRNYGGEKAEGFRRIERLVDRMMKASLDRMVDDGLIPAKLREDLQNKYQNYVPLKTLIEEDPASMFLGVGSGVDIRGSEVQRALGRESRADESAILAHAFVQAEVARIRGEKNRVAQTLLAFARSNPNNEVLQVKPRQVKRVLDKKTGLVTEVPDPTFKLADNAVSVKENGEEVLILFTPEHGDVALALKGMNAQQLGAFGSLIAKGTRTLAALSTRWNPAFTPFNAIRDLFGAGIHTYGDEGVRFAGAVMRDVMNGRAAAGLLALEAQDAAGSVTGKLLHRIGADKARWLEYAREYREDGAPVSFLNLDSVHDQMRRLQQSVKRMKGGEVLGIYALRGMGQAIGALNDVVENSARLSAYVHAREMLGWSRQRAGNYAKELTSNFESGGTVKAYLNGWYAFANAGIVGLRRSAQALKKPRTQKLVASMMLASLALDILNRLVAPDDEDGQNSYDAIPEFYKRANWIWMGGMDGDAVMIPKPFVFRWFDYAAQQFGAVMMGAKDPLRAGLDLGSAALDEFSPLGGGQASDIITPTVFDPWVQALRNEDWSGRKIKPQQFPFGPEKPESELYFKNVSPTAKAVARWLNEKSGGDSVSPGMADVSPEILEHYADTLAGGLGATVTRVGVILDKAMRGEDTEIRDVPIARRFFHTPHPAQSSSLFYETLKEIDLLDLRVETLRKEGRRDEARELRRENEALLRLKGRSEIARKRVKRLRDAMERKEGAERDQAAKRVLRAQQEFNRLASGARSE